MRVPGVDGTIARGPLLNTFVWWGGLNRILSILSATHFGWARFEPLPSSDRRGHAIWDVAGANGHEVGVFAWMNTWPPERVNGYLYPYDYSWGLPRESLASPGLLAALDAIAVEPNPYDAGLDYFHRRFNKAWGLWRASAPSVSLHFNKVADTVADDWAGDRFLTWPLDPATQVPEVLAEAYRLADHWIGRFHRDTPPGYVFAIVSDHGYEFDGTGHTFAPPGVLLLGALGLPASAAMPGRLLDEAWAGGEAPAPLRVAAYPEEWRGAASPESDEDADWEDVKRRLEALGYTN
jgi:hypothetical protein